MSLRAWSTSQTPTLVLASEAETSMTAALDLLAALASSNHLELYSPVDLDINKKTMRQAGHGGHAIVEIGVVRHPKKRLVAVKRSRVPSNPSSDDEQKHISGHEFEQLTRELRILAHAELYKHPSIIDILGLCFEDSHNSPALAIVLEYSSKGNLRDFLSQQGRNIPTVERSCFILQVAKGLKALHQLKVCHGDVKTENTLVFANGNGCQVKISDFGQSVFTTDNVDTEKVACPVGTRLLEAPELRRRQTREDRVFDIGEALLTDVFSFGLLAWEVIKHGKRYFDTEWVHPDPKHVDSNAMEEFLNRLPENDLMAKGLRFLDNANIGNEVHHKVCSVMECCLQDLPCQRQSIAHLVDILECEPTTALTALENDHPHTGGTLEGFDSLAIRDDTSSLVDADVDPYNTRITELGAFSEMAGLSIAKWGVSSSLYQLVHSGLAVRTILFQLPNAIPKRIVAELESLTALETLSQPLKAHAAMTLSECFAMGVGASTDTAQMLHWLGIAATLGNHKASCYYYRVCSAIDTTSDIAVNSTQSLLTEQRLSPVAPELYLLERIHHYNRQAIDEAQEITNRDQIFKAGTVPSRTPVVSLSIFRDSTVDKLLPIHVASLLGQNDIVKDLVMGSDRLVRSEQGFNAIHFACLGGQISTLRILLDASIPVLPASFQQITPLHLCIFFSEGNVSAAIGLLQDHQSSVDACTTDKISWDIHDFFLYGTPLAWAIQVRYRTMVQALLQIHTEPNHAWLFIAIEKFYWEILEDLYPHFKDDPDLRVPNTCTAPQTIGQPFGHWVAHGPEHISDIYKTIRRCNDYGFLGFGDNGNTHLISIIQTAATLDDLVIIDAIMSVSTPAYIRYISPRPFNDDAMTAALQSAGNNVAWTNILDTLASFYTLDELESNGFLIEAIMSDSVVGCRVLLQRGVDVNKRYSSRSTSLESAIGACISLSSSTDILSLIVEYGADVLARDPSSRLTALQRLLSGRKLNDTMLEILLQRNQPSAVYIYTLHYVLGLQFHEFLSSSQTGKKDPKSRGYERNLFRSLLTHPRFAPHINAPDEHGATLIQRAASLLHAPSVRLLLEAGADASIPFNMDSSSMLPLQMACSQARVLHRVIQHGVNAHNLGLMHERRRAQAMEVSSELLKWHIARSDGHFTGITELHLVCRMGLEEELEHVFDSNRQLDPGATGIWPGAGFHVTARELIKMDIPQELDIACRFPIYSFVMTTPLTEALDMPGSSDEMITWRADLASEIASLTSEIADLSSISAHDFDWLGRRADTYQDDDSDSVNTDNLEY